MRLNQFVLSIMAGLAAIGCSETEPVAQPQTESQPIVLSARINEGNLIDTRVADGAVSEGTYYLTFTNTKNDLQTVSASFADGTGYPWIYRGEEGGALNWGDILRPTNNQKATLYLDNVSGTTDDNGTVTLDSETYQATKYNTTTSANDIVWGSLPAAYNSTPLSFELTHRMASVRVNIKVDNDTEIENSIANDGVTVSLLNVKNIATNFNRTNGNVSVNNDAIAKSIQLHTGELEEGGYTPVWIFPPQTFDASYRPKLQIKLHNGTTYTGSLPQNMFTSPENGGSVTILAFNAGQLLTINVLLVKSIADRGILFLPAVVEDWKDIGEVSIISRQLGIYDEGDYAAVVQAYNQEPEKDEATLKRYAIYQNGKWEINIFANIGEEGELDDELKFNDNNQLVLDLHGWTVYGIKDENDLIKTPVTPPTEGEEGNQEDQEGQGGTEEPSTGQTEEEEEI